MRLDHRRELRLSVVAFGGFDQSAFAIVNVGARQGDGAFEFGIETVEKLHQIAFDEQRFAVPALRQRFGNLCPRRRLIRRHQNQAHAAFGVLALQLGQRRQFGHAGRAPRRPEVDDHDFAFLRFDGAVQRLRRDGLDLRRGLSGGKTAENCAQKSELNGFGGNFHGL